MPAAGPLHGSPASITLLRRCPAPPRLSSRERSATAWPKTVRNPASCRLPPPLSRPETSCSRTSSAAASWKRPPSIRKSGSTTRCSTWPSATWSWTSSRSRSCACWASAIAGPWWGGTHRSPRTSERSHRDAAGRSVRGRPFSSHPPGRQSPPAPSRRDPDATREAQLRVPPGRPAGRRLEAHERREVARPALRGRGGERDADAAVQARSGAVTGIEQELRARRDAQARRALVAPARRRQGEPPHSPRPPCHAELRAVEAAPCRHRGHARPRLCDREPLGARGLPPRQSGAPAGAPPPQPSPPPPPAGSPRTRPPPRSVPPPRREAQEDPVAPEQVHPVVLEQPVEGGAVVELDAGHDVHPQVGTVGIHAAAVVPREAEPTADVRGRDLLVAGKPVRGLETPYVRISAVQHPDLDGGAEPEARDHQIPRVERGPECELGAPEIDPAAHAEAEQPQPRPAIVPAPHRRRMELLSRERCRDR